MQNSQTQYLMGRAVWLVTEEDRAQCPMATTLCISVLIPTLQLGSQGQCASLSPSLPKPQGLSFKERFEHLWGHPPVGDQTHDLWEREF